MASRLLSARRASLSLALIPALLSAACKADAPPKPIDMRVLGVASSTSIAPAASTSPSTSALTSNSPQKKLFGAAIDDQTPLVPLADIVKDPKKYDGQKLRTRGEVVAVCQAAGCWTDLRPEGASTTAAIVPTHVTLHQHSFFLPKTIKGQVAEVEGTFASRALSQAEVDHFNGEGASLVAGALVVGIDATGVALR
jgi:hypothetical protein